MLPPTRRAIDRAALIQAAHRARQRAQWAETLARIATTPTRSPDEQEAKAEALELLEAARPGAVKPA
jgi:hypothetical protein